MVDDFWDLEYILYNVYAHISNSYITAILVATAGWISEKATLDSLPRASTTVKIDVPAHSKARGCPNSSLQRLYLFEACN